jgi:ribulose bisphosphate carboxylase small subunit
MSSQQGTKEHVAFEYGALFKRYITRLTRRNECRQVEAMLGDGQNQAEEHSSDQKPSPAAKLEARTRGQSKRLEQLGCPTNC